MNIRKNDIGILRSRIVIIILSTVFFLSIVGIGCIVFVNKLCSDEELTRVPSPDYLKNAVIIHSSCGGAPGEELLSIIIVNAGKQIPKKYFPFFRWYHANFNDVTYVWGPARPQYVPEIKWLNNSILQANIREKKDGKSQTINFDVGKRASIKGPVKENPTFPEN